MNGPEAATPGTPRILVVDDDADMRAFLRRTLGQDGHAVVEQPGGEHVLALLDSERFDALILDKEMPGVNGLDLLSQVCRRHPQTPVIFITAFGGARLAAEVIRLGAARYLEKPFRVAEIMDAIRGLVPRAEP